jgi:DNA-binding transcriptional LysR family regulator
MAMAQIDLHALRVFSEILKTGSLTRTAERVGLSQPAISLALAKLRRQFDDPLFVRVGNTMKATPQAAALSDKVDTAIAALEAALSFSLTFDPLTTDRCFRIAMTDVGQIVVLPRILQELAITAPHARLEVHNITERTALLLETGELDLAVGFVPSLPSGYFQQTLFQEQFACLARANHPRIKARLSLKQFKAEAHVVVSTSGTGHLIVDKTMEQLGIRRQVMLQIPNFLGLATVIGASDYLCTLPRRAAHILARHGEVKAWNVPVDLPHYLVKQHWHERQMRDPGNVWLRRLLADLYQGEETRSQRGPQ